MDRWLNNPNVVRAVSLILAVLLWALVQLDQRAPTASPSVIRPEVGHRMINDVRIDVVGLDEKSFAIRSIEPAYANISLSGPLREINRISPMAGESLVVADLSGLGEGTHEHVPLKTIGLPPSIDVEIYPAQVRVVIEEVKQKEMTVEVTLNGEPAEGFRVGEPVVNPAQVYVTLPSSQLDEVAAVRATVDVSGANDTIVVERKLTAYNQDGEPIEEAIITPSVVTVEVPVTTPFKTVPLTVRLTGEPRAGFSVENFTQDTTEVTLFAPEDVLNRYEFYGNLEVDISGLSTSESITVPIPIEDGIVRVKPEQVKVQVEIVPSTTRLIEQVPLTLNGRNADAQTVFLEPESGRIDLLLEGAPSRLNSIRLQDIRAIVDVGNLPPGEYHLPVRLQLPAFVRYGGEEPLSVRIAIRQQDDAPPTGADPPQDDAKDDEAVPSTGEKPGDREPEDTDEGEETPPPGGEENTGGHDSVPVGGGAE